MKTFAKTVAFILISLPLLASAGNKTASSSMQVSFVVKESCSVQSTDAAAKTPAVNCQLQTPYQLTRTADKAAATSATAVDAAIRTQTSGAQDWTVYF